MLPVPVSIRRYHDSRAEATLAAFANPDRCIAHVKIRDTECRWPYRGRQDIVYPIGRYSTCLCGPELRYAVDCGVVAEVYSAAEYTCAPLLAPFYHGWLTRLMDARIGGRQIEQQWIKRVMNALVGKFGEPGRYWAAAGRRTEMGPYGTWYEPGENGELTRYRNIAWYTQREIVQDESYWSCPAIAGWITSAGRSRLWNYIETAGRKNVWYCDTDSIICGQEGYDRLLSGGFVRADTPGYLRIVGHHSRCVIYGIRHYQLDDSISCAGVPRGLIEPGETREQYWHRHAAKDEIAVGLRPSGDRECGFYPVASDYHHGRVMPDGSVLPLEIYDG